MEPGYDFGYQTSGSSRHSPEAGFREILARSFPSTYQNYPLVCSTGTGREIVVNLPQKLADYRRIRAEAEDRARREEERRRRAAAEKEARRRDQAARECERVARENELARNGMDVQFTNNCREDVKVAVLYFDVSKNGWFEKYWYEFSAGETSLFGGVKARPSDDFYIYAKSRSYVWDGDLHRSFVSSSFGFRNFGCHHMNIKTPYGMGFFFQDTPAMTYLLVGLGCLASALLPRTKYSVLAALFLGWIRGSLLTRNPFIRNPGMPYMGWMMLAIALIAWWNRDGRPRNWHFPAAVFWCAWALLGAGYTLSGIHKLASPSWQDGMALHYLLQNPLSRPGIIVEILGQLPDWVMKVKSWGVVTLEVSSLPLMLFAATRPYVWFALLVMHVGIMLTVDFVDLTLGMIMMYLFVFDEKWLRPTSEPGILFFDGVCNLCNGFANTVIDVGNSAGIQLSTLQGATASRYGVDQSGARGSIIYLVNDDMLDRSTALIAIGRRAGGLLCLAEELAALLPLSLRDRIYDRVARNRYRFFGQKELCRLPTAEEREFFCPDVLFFHRWTRI